MFPFEPSFIGIALLVAITTIIILYVTLLLRLKPPTETTIKRPPKKEPSTKEPVKPPATQPELSIEEQKSPKRPTVPGKTSKSAILVEISETPEKPSEHIEAPESTEETPASARPPECPHYFGYLKKLPKNAQIPDECLGCPRLVECIHSTPMLEQS